MSPASLHRRKFTMPPACRGGFIDFPAHLRLVLSPIVLRAKVRPREGRLFSW